MAVSVLFERASKLASICSIKKAVQATTWPWERVASARLILFWWQNSFTNQSLCHVLNWPPGFPSWACICRCRSDFEGGELYWQQPPSWTQQKKSSANWDIGRSSKGTSTCMASILSGVKEGVDRVYKNFADCCKSAPAKQARCSKCCPNLHSIAWET